MVFLCFRKEVFELFFEFCFELITRMSSDGVQQKGTATVQKQENSVILTLSSRIFITTDFVTLPSSTFNKQKAIELKKIFVYKKHSIIKIYFAKQKIVKNIVKNILNLSIIR